jgi:hypothetical protein
MHTGVNGGNQSGSPVKESSYLNRETSAEELEEKDSKDGGTLAQSISPPTIKDGIPIRR